MAKAWRVIGLNVHDCEFIEKALMTLWKYKVYWQSAFWKYTGLVMRPKHIKRTGPTLSSSTQAENLWNHYKGWLSDWIGSTWSYSKMLLLTMPNLFFWYCLWNKLHSFSQFFFNSLKWRSLFWDFLNCNSTDASKSSQSLGL